nr:hypothetical protein [Gammaproteobacteria bacterium]
IAPDFEAPQDHDTDSIYTAEITVADATGKLDSQLISVQIIDVNEPPQLLSAPAVLATEDNQYSYTLAATDPDAGAQLVLSVETLPQWLSLAAQSENTWTLTGLPANADVGDHLVSLQVSDGELSVSQQFTVAVENVNNAPAITSSGGAELVDLVASEFTNTVATFSASDIDLDSQLVYSITGGEDAPSFSIDPEQGILAFVITPDSLRPIDSNGDGVYLVEVTVSDQNGAADTQVVRISTGMQNGWEPSIVPVQGNLHQYEPVATIIVPADTQVKPEKDSDETASPYKVVDSRLNPETEPTPPSETRLQFPAQPLPLEFTVASVQGTRAGSASATDADLTQSNDTNVLRKILRIWQSQSLESLELQLGEHENSRFYRELDEQMEEMDSLAASENKKNKLIAQVATGVSITLTAGFVSWVLRAGSLVASLLSNMPIWRQMDVLPILSDREDGRGRLGDTVDGEAPVQTPSVTDADDKAEDLFRFRR